MTQEEKELLLKELCARLPYGVICQFIWSYSNETTDEEVVTDKDDDNIKCINIHTKEIQADYYDEWVDLEHCKPYLRPMSSMTEEEKRTYTSLRAHAAPFTIVNWLDENHFDHRTNMEGEYLIELGLALEAPEGMYDNH